MLPAPFRCTEERRAHRSPSSVPRSAPRRTCFDAERRIAEISATHRDMPVSSGERRYAARPAIRERKNATAWATWGDRVSALLGPLDDLQDFGFRRSEALVGVLKQFLRNGEIDQRGMNVAVT